MTEPRESRDGGGGGGGMIKSSTPTSASSSSSMSLSRNANKATTTSPPTIEDKKQPEIKQDANKTQPPPPRADLKFIRLTNEVGTQLFSTGGVPAVPLDFRFAPEVPFFSLYQDPVPFVIFCAKLPAIMHENIPETLKQILTSINTRITSIDVFVVAQEFLIQDYVGKDLQLRAHFWACPGPHPHNTRKKGAIHALLHDFDPEIDLQLLTDQFTRHTWSIHPVKRAGGLLTAYSPSNCLVKVKMDSINNSGWTIVMDEWSGRVAVTLHGFLSNNPVGRAPADFVQRALGRESTTTLYDLVQVLLDDGEHAEVLRPFGLKLQSLLRTPSL